MLGSVEQLSDYLLRNSFIRFILHSLCRLPISGFYYENTPMQYAANFHGCKNENFQMKNYDIFLIFAQNINCGYTLEAVLTSTQQSMFQSKSKKNVYLYM